MFISSFVVGPTEGRRLNFRVLPPKRKPKFHPLKDKRAGTVSLPPRNMATQAPRRRYGCMLIELRPQWGKTYETRARRRGTCQEEDTTQQPPTSTAATRGHRTDTLDTSLEPATNTGEPSPYPRPAPCQRASNPRPAPGNRANPPGTGPRTRVSHWEWVSNTLSEPGLEPQNTLLEPGLEPETTF